MLGNTPIHQKNFRIFTKLTGLMWFSWIFYIEGETSLCIF